MLYLWRHRLLAMDPATMVKGWLVLISFRFFLRFIFLRGMLMHESGFVLKPVQAPPKGLREVTFYQTISTSTTETDGKFKALTAKFFGTDSVKLSNGDYSEYLVLG